MSSTTINGTRSEAIRRAIRKWQRLREELEECMVRATSTSPGAAASSLSPLARKRRVDLALTVSELHQNQRRRLNPTHPSRHRRPRSNPTHKSNSNAVEVRRYSLDSGILAVLKRQSLGMPVDASLADQLLHNPYEMGSDEDEGRRRVGRLLAKHPLAITALLRTLFQPGGSTTGSTSGSRSSNTSLELKMKCAKLIALAVLASERCILDGLDSGATSNGKEKLEKFSLLDEGKLANILLKGSQLCNQVENIVLFTVTENLKEDNNSSIGSQLSYLCIHHAPVAHGFLLWATERSSGTEFAASVAYPTLAPGILSLVRIIARHHPYCRKAVLRIALSFLKHTNPEQSYQKTKALKEQILRLLLWLSTQGLATDVFDAIAFRLLRGGSSEIDTSLLRYFVGGMLEIVRPPLSVPFVRSVGGMLQTKSCVDALRSTYFSEKDKRLLSDLIGTCFVQTVSEERCKFTKSMDRDRAMVSSLCDLYQCHVK